MKLNFPPPDLSPEDVPEEMRRQWEALEKVTDAAAQACAKTVDDEITKAIQMRIGMDWKPMHMAGRLSRTIYMDGSEVMVLDGIPIMHIGPWIVGQTGPSTRMTVTRECTHLKGASDLPVQ